MDLKMQRLALVSLTIFLFITRCSSSPAAQIHAVSLISMTAPHFSVNSDFINYHSLFIFLPFVCIFSNQTHLLVRVAG